MLDALVAEARLRWGLDPAIGLQVVAGETLVAVPIEASRPLLTNSDSCARAVDSKAVHCYCRLYD